MSLAACACCCCACSKLLKLAQQVTGLDAAVLVTLTSTGGDGSPTASRHHSSERLSALAGKLNGAATAGRACVRLGEQLNLEAGDAYRCGAAAGTVLNSGQAMLEALLGAIKYHPRLDDDDLTGVAHECIVAQLGVVAALLGMEPQQQRVVPALAASVARPQVLLRWLSTLTETLALTCQTEKTGGCCCPLLQAAGNSQQCHLVHMESA